MTVYEKLSILTDAAKYDVACTSSGSSRGAGGSVGSARASGICHTWSADGRCVSLLKVLFSNYCEYDCAFCINRKSNDRPRTAFTPRELADLTMDFYRRNFIEGLFVSSGVIKNPDHTMELMIKCIRILREEYRFNGYIHAKVIPGASKPLIDIMGSLVDRVSVNIELPSEASLKALAPEKSRNGILRPMKAIAENRRQAQQDMVLYKSAPKFAPAGRSTQINRDKRLPSQDTKPPLMREHRLYQADWLLRFYGFKAEEILSEKDNMFNSEIDPKCNWALHNLQYFPVEVNTCPYEMLLRVPGIGVTSALRIVKARRAAYLDFDGLKRLGVVMKRAKYFITCKGKMMRYVPFEENKILLGLTSRRSKENFRIENRPEQLSMFDRMANQGRGMSINV